MSAVSLQLMGNTMPFSRDTRANPMLRHLSRQPLPRG
jgi:hypothetical protein